MAVNDGIPAKVDEHEIHDKYKLIQRYKHCKRKESNIRRYQNAREQVEQVDSRYPAPEAIHECYGSKYKESIDCCMKRCRRHKDCPEEEDDDGNRPRKEVHRIVVYPNRPDETEEENLHAKTLVRHHENRRQKHKRPQEEHKLVDRFRDFQFLVTHSAHSIWKVANVFVQTVSMDIGVRPPAVTWRYHVALFFKANTALHADFDYTRAV